MACSTSPTSWAWLSPRLLTTSSNSTFKLLKSPTNFCCINIGPTDNSTPSSSIGSLRRECSPETEIDRRWIKAETHLHSPLLSQERFTVVSYNILGDKNASKHRDLYQNVPSFYLNWGRRKRVICEELTGWNPDIICLQEVDKYFELSSTMEKAGYLGSYKRRTGDIVDGCAMFWKADKFRLVGGESIEFKQYGLRDNVAQLSVFEVDVQR